MYVISILAILVWVFLFLMLVYAVRAFHIKVLLTLKKGE